MSITLRKLTPVVLLAAAWGLAAQVSDLSLGNTAFVTEAPPTPVLRKNIDKLDAWEVLSAVGGVAFGAVATPGPGFERKKLALFHDPSKPDGERLVIQVGERQIAGDLPDWLLIPTARFADSEYNACVSLVTSKEKDSYDITYHSAFQNTLLGLRLLHADILLMKMGEYWDLPRFGDRRVVGLGETLPDEDQRRRALRAAREIDDVLALEFYDSWLLTDTGEEVVFTLDGGGSLRLTGEPYYFFWKAGYEDYRRSTEHFGEWAASLKAATTEYGQQIESAHVRIQELEEERNRLISEGHGAYSRMREGLSDSQSVDRHLDDLRAQAKELGRLLDVEVARHRFLNSKSGKLVAWHNQLVGAGNQLRPEVIEVEHLNAAMRERRNHLETFNPVVYHAARQVMRFAALFRYIKQTDNTAWTQFLQQLEGLTPQPAIGTPVQMPKPARVRGEGSSSTG